MNVVLFREGPAVSSSAVLRWMTMGVWFGVWSGPLRVNALFCVHSNQVLFLEKPDEPLYQEGAVLANRRMRLEGKVNKQENADRLAQCILVAFFQE